MEPRFQTSFIPKKPVITPSGSELMRSGGMGLFSTIATVSFIITILMSGSLFLYKNLLTSQVNQADKDLVSARAAFEPEKIQELIDMNSRILVTKQLLEKHVVISQILSLLQNLTVKKVRITDFSYTNKNDTPTISMSAEAQSYNAVAGQSNFFAQNDLVKSSQFSDFTLSDNGTISFKIFATLSPKLISYKQFITDISQ